MSIDLLHFATDVVFDALNELDPFKEYSFEGLDLTDYDYGHETAALVPAAFLLLYSPNHIDPNEGDRKIVRDGVEFAFSMMFESFTASKALTDESIDMITDHLLDRLMAFEEFAFGDAEASEEEASLSIDDVAAFNLPPRGDKTLN